MEKLSAAGRIFYGISIAGLGLQAIYYADFPYMLIPPNHEGIAGLAIISYFTGAVFMLSGITIIFTLKTRLIALLLSWLLMLVFCFYYLPYQFITTSNYLQLISWDNPAKELALTGGALIIAGNFTAKNESNFEKLSAKLLPLKYVLFCVPVISFSLLHFIYGKDVADYIPSWVPARVFWGYAAGVPLFCSGIAILLNIKRQIMAIVLGAVIFTWFIILHIPKVIASPFDNMGAEATSAFIALAYSGTAFVIAGERKSS